MGSGENSGKNGEQRSGKDRRQPGRFPQPRSPGARGPPRRNFWFFWLGGQESKSPQFRRAGYLFLMRGDKKSQKRRMIATKATVSTTWPLTSVFILDHGIPRVCQSWSTKARSIPTSSAALAMV